MEGRPTLLRTRAAVALTILVALLSFVTGIVNIGATAVSGPLARYVPAAAARTAGFTGTLTGFLMLASAFGMRRRLRAAWYSTVVLLPVTALQGLLQSSVASFPLVVLSLVAMPAVLANRRHFDRAVDLSTAQLAALAAIAGVQVYGTAGAYALREEFTGVATLTDAFYYTIVTASTVGYGDVTPTTAVARLFGMSVVLLGTASFAVALGTLFGPAIEKRLSRALGSMSDSDLDLLEDHVVVLGYSDLTEPILEQLAPTSAFVVITRQPEHAAELAGRGYNVLTADPSDEDPLRRAGIERARALVAATDDDAQDALAILTARSLNPGVRIVAGATERENVNKLRRAGADAVISPAVIGGHLLARSAVGEGDMEGLADRILDAGASDDLS